MLSFRLRGGLAAVENVLARLEIPYHAPSLGGVETLIVRPAASSHAGLAPEERRRIGVTDDLLRVSCGIEHVEDLLADFRQALDAA
jgi:cystathionine beta-lyase/cystathionine gamma-synthase